MRPHVHLDGPSFFLLGMQIAIWLAIFSVAAIVFSSNWVGKFLAFIK